MLKLTLDRGGILMMPVYDQPMRKLLGVLSPTISWLNEKGTVDVGAVPDGHLEAIKQLERIGVVHKRNNRCYELQKIRLKKLLGNLGIETLVAEAAATATVEAVLVEAVPAAAGAAASAAADLN
jgi:hypothetical protein